MSSNLTPKPNDAPICPYDGVLAEFWETSQLLYSSGQDYGPAWVCPKCRAFCGCHPGTSRPLGVPADAATRMFRSDAHKHFDRIWRAKMVRQGISKSEARGAGYKWLGQQLGIPASQCHIGMMNTEQAKAVAALCKPIAARLMCK
jgi:hypothetical protein